MNLVSVITSFVPLTISTIYSDPSVLSAAGPVNDVNVRYSSNVIPGLGTTLMAVLSP